MTDVLVDLITILFIENVNNFKAHSFVKLLIWLLFLVLS